MRSAPRIALLVAALALPIAVVLVSYALTDGPRAPQVPTVVRVGVSAGPEPPPNPPPAPPPTEPVAPELPPPPPQDDDDDGQPTPGSPDHDD